MKSLHKRLLAGIAIVSLAACGGGGDAGQPLADPVVRLVHASPIAPNVTLSRDSDGQVFVADAPFPFASAYLDVDTGFADWSVRASVGGGLIGTVPIDPVRGTKYTVVVVPAANSASTAAVIADPFILAPDSKSSRLRVFNASPAIGAVDLYVNAPGTDIGAAAIEPLIAATAYKTSGPASGEDALHIAAGSYQIDVTAAGTKTVLFNGQFTIAGRLDMLFAIVPNAASASAVRLFVKIDGQAGMIEILPCGGTPATSGPVCL